MMLAACGESKTEQTYGVIQDEKFGAVYLDVSIEDFIAAGLFTGMITRLINRFLSVVFTRLINWAIYQPY